MLFRSILSANVDLPWSMWAMMQKLRIRSGEVDDGSMEDVGTSGGSSFDDLRGLYRPMARGSGISHCADTENVP